MPGTLFVVATPIGNLEDITLRALRVLRDVDLIAAEDTRRTSRLLARHGIATPSLSFHAHNARVRVPQLIGRLSAGQSIALVSDAGTPGVSDPGVELVDACLKSEIAVEPIPGVSAGLTAAVASGFPLIPLTMLGFPPHKANDRISWLTECLALRTTITFFEAPHRIAQTLRAAAPILGDRPIMVGRELTKMHQEFLRGTALELSERLHGKTKGEFTVVVGPMTNSSVSTLEASDSAIADEFARISMNRELSRRQALTATAKHFGVSARAVYAALERGKIG